jgi:hypothetical protein
MSAAGKRYMGKVAKIGCVLCAHLGHGKVAATVHHLRAGQGTGERSSHFLTIALCPDCHQGPNGLHGNRSLMRIAKLDELDLLALTIEALNP